MNMKRHWSDRLPKNACADAVRWAKTQPTAAEAWKNCTRGDWMLWILGRLSDRPGSTARRKLALCCCDCAETVRHLWPTGDTRPAEALRVTRAWATRTPGVTIDDVRAAAEAAWSAGAAAWSAGAAAGSAGAAGAAAGAVAGAVATRAAEAAGAVARAASLRSSADIVRRYYPRPPRVR